MNSRDLKKFRGWAFSAVSSLVAILAALFCLQQSCQAQLVSQSGASANPLTYVNWFSGPQTVTLGNVADVNIPDGYRLTGVDGAQMILTSINNPIPDDLVGILTPETGKWMAILEYSPSGYVKDPDVKQIDTKAVLRQVLDQITWKNGQSVASLSWQSQPSYHASSHLLEWSFLVTTPTSTKVLSQTAAILGRHGVLQVTIVRPLSLTDVPSPEQLASNITFKNGERYTDYQSGDKVAELELADLICGTKHPQATRGGTGAAAASIYSVITVGLVTGGIVIIRRRNKTKNRPEVVLRGKRRHHRHRSRVPVPALAAAIKNKAPVTVSSTPSGPSPVAVKNSPSISPAWPKPVFKYSNGSRSFHRHRRKRIFDYPKFYTKVMSELSFTYLQATNTNGKSHSNGRANGHGNGNSNGHGNHHSNNHPAPSGTNANQPVKSEIEDLIATQKSLIQEQKKTLEQQEKLIEEKRSLIEEQTALLKTQTALAADELPIHIKI